MSENDLRWHVEWLGHAQTRTVGLVVTAPALVEAGVWPDRNVSARQEQLKVLVGEARQLRSVTEFLCAFLGWRPQHFRAPLDAEKVYLEEYEETLSPDAVVVSAEGQRLALVQQVPNAVRLDDLPTDATGWHATPQARFERLLRDTKTPIGLLSNGRGLRLVYAPSGESAGHLTFLFSDLCEPGGRTLLAAMGMLLEADRWFLVAHEQRLPAVLAASRKFQSQVSTRLSEQVLEALHLLLHGIDTADALSNRRLLKELRKPENRERLTQGLLTVVMRLVFLLYAEDKGLMPDSTAYATSYSVTGLFEQLRDDEARFPDLMKSRYGAWARLLTLFRLVFRGGGAGDLKLPKRQGELFDPDAFPFLEGRTEGDHFSSDKSVKLKDLPRVSDETVFGVLRNLLVLDGERLSYRALDVEQIGSVYESMMGFELMEAKGRSIALRPAHVVVDLDALLSLKGKKRTEFLKDEVGGDFKGRAGKEVEDASTFDALMAALDRRRSPLTKEPLKTGELFLQPGPERRRSGSHYTPRSLTAPIVARTLEPMLRSLGPSPTPRMILELKVCDPAMGSGAFLVEACRFLGKALEAAWSKHKLTPQIPPDEDVTLHAQRVVAQKCLYGVDKNPMAVQLSKLSLWLFTLAKDHPFTFLDHALKCGDALVGLSRTQIERLTWGDEGSWTTTFTATVKQLVERGESMRLQIHDLTDPIDTTQLLRLHDDAEVSLETARLLGHLTVGAFFLEDKEKAKIERLKTLAARIQALFNEHLGLSKRAVGEDGVAPEVAQLNFQLRSLWDEQRSGETPIPERPFHWELEFPEVFGKGRDGFDSIVGNPPFSGKNGISEAGGEEYIEWLKTVHENSHGNADLSAHFFRRAYSLLCDHGTLGLISTNTLLQGDTRRTGLKYILSKGGEIFAGQSSMLWEGVANVAFVVVHLAKGRDRESIGQRVLDGKPVPVINSRLRAKPEQPDPVRLKANANLSFQGTVVLGMGFVLSPEERDAFVKKDKRNAERIFPYIGGEEVNTSPTQDFNRYVICFSELPKKAGEKFRSLSEDEAREWTDLYKRVRELVKPERDRNNRDVYRLNWWIHGEPRPALYEVRAGLRRCLTIARVTKHVCFSFQPTDRLFHEKLIVVPLESMHVFACLQSRLHERWVWLLSSTMKQDLNYSPSDCFENFPFPKSDPRTELPALEALGQKLYDARAAYMKSTKQGLTQTYNHLKDPACADEAVVALRELHVELDRAVLEAYGWGDVQVPPYTTPETDEERARFEAFEDDVLDRLFALNAQRAALENVAPPAASPTSKKKPKKSSKKSQPTLDLDET